jgi:hypothetical protein
MAGYFNEYGVFTPWTAESYNAFLQSGIPGINTGMPISGANSGYSPTGTNAAGATINNGFNALGIGGGYDSGYGGDAVGDF